MVKVEHINYPLVAKTHPPMYLMHKYWARKPHNVVSKYIEAYSKEGDIVFDPFCGSGVTGVESVVLGRKAILNDLDPMGIFITKATVFPVDIESFTHAFDRIKESCMKRINDLYRTKCPDCQRWATIIQSIWEGKDDDPNQEEMISILYSCKCHKDRKLRKKNVEDSDRRRLDRIRKSDIPCWYPDAELIWNSRINVHRGMKVSDLFTKRNLIALTTLFEAILREEDSGVRDLLKLTFTSTTAQASRMMGDWPSSGPSWKVRGYWIPQRRKELNVWRYFENRFKRVLKGKKEANGRAKRVKEAGTAKDLRKDADILILNKSSLDLKEIPSNSADYVFTDPPYGDEVPYLELHYMWSLWLGFKPRFKEEIVISDSPARDKDFDEYYRMMIEAFREVFRVLKPDKWMTVTFHSTDVHIYNSIIRAVLFAGFELDKVVYQPPAMRSSKGSLHPYGSAVGDYYLRFHKPKVQRKLPTEKDVDKLRFERVVIESVKRIIALRGQPTTYTDLLKSIYVELDKFGYLLVAQPEDIKRIVKKHEGKELVFVPKEGWWFKNPEKYWLHIVPLQDRIEKSVVQTLKRKHKASFDEILQETFHAFQNALAPNPPSVRMVLDEYAVKTKDKKWKLKPKVSEREDQHTIIIGHLAELGKKAGYRVLVGKPEQGQIYDGERLSQLSAKRIPFPLSEEQSSNIERIDAIWFDKNGVRYAFEVEHTTGITEALLRGSYIPDDDVKRYLVIPEERERLLYRKIGAPLISDKIAEYKWGFIFYDDLETLYRGYKRKKFEGRLIDDLGRTLKPREKKQASLAEYGQ